VEPILERRVDWRDDPGGGREQRCPAVEDVAGAEHEREAAQHDPPGAARPGMVGHHGVMLPRGAGCRYTTAARRGASARLSRKMALCTSTIVAPDAQL